jgi:holin-like protein
VIALLYLFGFYYAGEFLSHSLHLPVPGNVLGLLMLFILLIVRRGVPASLDAVVPRLLGYMVLFFMPAAVGVVALGPLLAQEGRGIVFTMVVSTLIPLALLAYGLDAWLRRRRAAEAVPSVPAAAPAKTLGGDDSHAP